MSKETLVSYELALKMKDAGFDWGTVEIYCNGKLLSKEPCRVVSYYSDDPERSDELVYAPTLSLAAKWFREEKGLIILPHRFIEKPNEMHYRLQIHEIYDGLWLGYKGLPIKKKSHDTYEAALEAGLNEAIEILKG